MALIELNNVRKKFTMGDEMIWALSDINLSIQEGELTSIIGTSGCGKSTLMNIIGLLDLPTLGKYVLDGQDTTIMSDDNLSLYRNQKIGFVFQSFNLLPKATAIKNVAMPLQYATYYHKNLSEKEINSIAEENLKKVGLADRINHLPNELSGGQRQRVAIARALVNSPKLLLADEPTGALDSKTSHEILDLFTKLNNQGVTVIIVTHDQNVANRCRRILRMHDGKIIEDTTQLANKN